MPKVTKSHWVLVNVNQCWRGKKKKIGGGRREKVKRKIKKKKPKKNLSHLFEGRKTVTVFADDGAVQLKWRLMFPVHS